LSANPSFTGQLVQAPLQGPLLDPEVRQREQFADRSSVGRSFDDPDELSEFFCWNLWWHDSATNLARFP
jgi:hypothetical protein